MVLILLYRSTREQYLNVHKPDASFESRQQDLFIQIWAAGAVGEVVHTLYACNPPQKSKAGVQPLDSGERGGIADLMYCARYPL